MPSGTSSTMVARWSDLIREASTRIPARSTAIPGLRDPNERMEKGLAKSVAYRILANESVISRNVAKRLSEQWGRDASLFHQKWQDELESGLEEVGLRQKLKRVEHHLSHAANAYFNSGFDEALIVTLDGYGSGLAGTISVGRGGNIQRLHGVEYPHSLGNVLRIGHVSAGFQAQPPRRKDRGAGGLW